MRIAVNTRLLLEGKLEGIGWFTYEVFKRIAINHPEHEFIFLFDRPFNNDFIFAKNVTAVKLNPPARHPILWYLFFEWSVAKALKKYKADVFVSPDGWLSLRSNVKQLAVIHDLNFEHFPQFLKLIHRVYLHYYFHRFAKKANRIVTVSEYSKNDISNLYGIDKNIIDVVYNGSNNIYKPISNILKDKTRSEYTNNKPYFIFIGSLHPRKNLSNLFKAFDLFKHTYQTEIKLVIVGQKQWWTGEISETYNAMKFKDDVQFTGRLSPDILNNLLASSIALTYVSLFEGFGIPIVEAFNAGTAVITSNITSMPEVAGDAALLVNPFSINSIADAMHQMNTDNELRSSLIEKGNLRKLKYSWDKTAETLWKSIEQLF